MRETRTVAAVVLWWLAMAGDGSLPFVDGHRHAHMGALQRLTGPLRDRMLDVVGPDDIVDRLDVDAVIERVDVDRLLARVDVNGLLARVDVNRLLARVDVAAVLARVDVDVLLARVDIAALLDRVDVDALLARVDVDAVMEQVDVARLVERAGIPDIVAESTGSVAESVLDMARRQLLGVDVVLSRAVMRVRSRGERSLPAGPQTLIDHEDPAPAMPAPNAAGTDVTGHYAGGITRLVAFVVDVTLAGGAFTITSGALGSALRVLGARVDGSAGGGVVLTAALVLWLFTYWWASTAVAGRTPGMALVGLRVVTRSGTPVSGRRALVRVLVLPVSVVLWIPVLIGFAFDRERRALHDLLAGTTVVFDWGDRTATMPTPLARWLADRDVPIDLDTATARARHVRLRAPR